MIILTQQCNRHVYIGCIHFTQRNVQHLAAAGKGHHLRAQHAAPFDRHPRQRTRRKRVGKEHPRSLPSLIDFLFCLQAQMLVGQVRPGGSTRPANPHQDLCQCPATAHFQAVNTSRRRGKLQHRPPVGIGAQICPTDPGHNFFKWGCAACHSIEILHPFDAVEGCAQRAICSRAILPVKGDDRKGERSFCRLNPRLGTDADSKIRWVDQGLTTPGNRKTALIRQGHFQGENLIAVCFQHSCQVIAQKGQRETSITAGHTAATLNKPAQRRLKPHPPIGFQPEGIHRTAGIAVRQVCEGIPNVQ